jgi:hypothetical protein
MDFPMCTRAAGRAALLKERVKPGLTGFWRAGVIDHGHRPWLPSTEVLGHFQLPLRGTVPIDSTPEDVNQSPRNAAKSHHAGPAEPTYGRAAGGRGFRMNYDGRKMSVHRSVTYCYVAA